MTTTRSKSYQPSFILLTNFLLCLTLEAEPGYVAGELLVKWQDGPESYAAVIGNAQIGSTVKRNFEAIGWQHIQLPPGMSLRDGIEAYRALGTVLAVEPNGVMVIQPLAGRAVPSAPSEGGEAALDDGAVGTPRPPIRRHGPDPPLPPPGLIPNDPMFSQQWYLRKIGATNAWATTTGSTNIVIAVFDTGVDYTHPDLAAIMWRNPGETGLDANGNDKPALTLTHREANGIHRVGCCWIRLFRRTAKAQRREEEAAQAELVCSEWVM